MSDDETYLICALVDGHAPIGGSIIASCVRCSRNVWLAPTGQEIVAAEQALTLCIPCGMQSIAEDEEPHLMHVTQAQRDEIVAELRRRREM